ncbi:MAG: hypothetical protein AAF462_04495 [Thermodesulfobacteriota bacterium]
MKKYTGIFIFIFLFGFTAQGSEVDDLLITVDVDDRSGGGCSIMKAKPDGSISEFVSGTDILSITGRPGCDLEDTGIASLLDGVIYFNEDRSGDILFAATDNIVRRFIADEVLDTLLPDNVDIDNGMAVNKVTGTLVIADENNGAILELPPAFSTPIVDPSLVKILATGADFEALVPLGSAINAEGGIAIDDQQNIYVANEDLVNNTANVIFKLTPQGDVSVLCTQAELMGVIGVAPRLDVGMAFDGSLFVADSNCNCVLEINPVSCSPQILIAEAQINSLTGNTSADLNGGLCIDRDKNLYVGDNGSISQSSRNPSIIKIPTDINSSASLFVSADQVRALYGDIAPDGNPQFQGLCTVKLADTGFNVPALSNGGAIVLALVLGLTGLFIARRKMAAL